MSRLLVSVFLVAGCTHTGAPNTAASGPCFPHGVKKAVTDGEAFDAVQAELGWNNAATLAKSVVRDNSTVSAVRVDAMCEELCGDATECLTTCEEAQTRIYASQRVVELSAWVDDLPRTLTSERECAPRANATALAHCLAERGMETPELPSTARLTWQKSGDDVTRVELETLVAETVPPVKIAAGQMDAGCGFTQHGVDWKFVN